MKKILLTFFITLSLFSCANNKNKVIEIEMSEETKTFIENMGFDSAKSLEKEYWDSMMVPWLLSRESGYIDMNIYDNDNKPINFKSNYNDKYQNIDYVSSFTPKNNKFNRIILYIHGGAYISEALNSHAIFCDDLSINNDALVIVPNYGLTPNYTYEEAYKMLDEVYSILLEYNLPIIIAGDSAGGGLAASYTMYLRKNNIKTPNKIILNSPWLDLTMSNPEIIKYQNTDRMLAPYGLVECGKYWSGNLETNDYRISPIYGDFTDFPETLLFRSTWEIFYPDEIILENLLNSNNIKHTIVEEKGFIHTAPLFYYLEEYTAFQNIIKDFIKQ